MAAHSGKGQVVNIVAERKRVSRGQVTWAVRFSESCVGGFCLLKDDNVLFDILPSNLPLVAFNGCISVGSKRKELIIMEKDIFSFFLDVETGEWRIHRNGILVLTSLEMNDTSFVKSPCRFGVILSHGSAMLVPTDSSVFFEDDLLL